MTTIIGDTEERADERASGQYALESSGEGTTLEHTTEQSTREATICVVGLGYVGLPLAVGFAQSDYRVIGYDVDDVTVDRLQEGIDTTGDLTDEAIQDGDISYTTDATTITEADYVIIAVPTPIDDDEQPDLGYVESAATTVGSKLDPGTTVVLESTVYPGSTREVLVPALEDASGLSAGEDFFVGYSPERATPADNDHGLEDVVKVVGAQNDTVLEDVATLYESVVDAGVHPPPRRSRSPRRARSSKTSSATSTSRSSTSYRWPSNRWDSTRERCSRRRGRSGTSTTTGRGSSAGTAFRSIRTSSRIARSETVWIRN